jgi:hypothetical protein
MDTTPSSRNTFSAKTIGAARSSHGVATPVHQSRHTSVAKRMHPATQSAVSSSIVVPNRTQPTLNAPSDPMKCGEHQSSDEGPVTKPIAIEPLVRAHTTFDRESLVDRAPLTVYPFKHHPSLADSHLRQLRSVDLTQA